MSATVVWAHSPVFPEENHSIETAHEIDNPAKSWATYTSLDHSDSGDFYKFQMPADDRILISLLTPENPSESGFLPSFALLVPRLNNIDSVPSYIEIPEGYGSIVANGIDPGQATYEPFTPGWFYDIATLDMKAPTSGTYYVVVYDSAQKTGSYGLPVGYIEQFTPTEIVSVQYNVRQVYLWEGQNPFLTFLPIMLTLIVGAIIFALRNRRQESPQGISKWLAAFAGLAFIGSAASILYQMILALSVTGATKEIGFTLIFVAISIVLGLLTLRYALSDKPVLTTRRRVALIVIGVVALFAWSGLYFGTALAIAAAVIPARYLQI